jgi:hypothetical protein
MFDRGLIDRYERGGERIRHAIAGLARADLLAFPVPGTWSIQQIVVHLLDSDLIAVHRMKRIIAEDVPLLIGYDETRFANELAYDDQPVDDVIRLFELNRRLFVPVLRRLPDAAFGRYGVHNARGRVTLGEMVADYVQHVDHHLRFVNEKRALLGRALEE